MDKINITDFPEYHREEAAEVVGDVGNIDPREIAKEYPVLFLVIRFSAPLLDDMTVAKIVLATRGVCHYCGKSGNPCYCTRDD
jgi:hypothetical protein